ncbi:MAG: dihydrodipicolinate synthase family protein [Peptococcaceae bacterium]|jgi:4-hydroxy-2-oxoglutarate aldolase|nr:dihydrodipicolinate synthase family protein [Peptococcaceae bacterium]
MENRLRGIFAPLSTPFDAWEETDWPQPRGKLTKWMRTGLSGVMVPGSSGEFPYLDREEKERLVAFGRENPRRDKAVIACTGCGLTWETIGLTTRTTCPGTPE